MVSHSGIKNSHITLERTASTEASQKQFTSVKSHRFNAFLAQAQLQRARKIASATHYPLIEVDSSQQVGHNFGERLSNAVDLVFSKGFTNVVIIGSDCLALSSGDIMQAVEE